MITIVIQHPVADYEAWKQTFDRDPLHRAASGVIGHAIHRTFDRASVLVLMDFATRKQAEDYLPRLEALWKTMSGPLGLARPTATIYECIETEGHRQPPGLL
jgi:hypothetical protein